ncbi:hypothetical protein HG536_0G01550 [Torulaspora globosa]|uniref:Required for respiratory growth protein 8, mitochondrial n=1 Tax=Torulaspora globosa TaxID=48254 RepID=A0A7G3ZLB0_9SACH|nr:uncharacterized protein HG536_0G01550 [Torulaspora globosa]QLL34296.1 hypothetical protein HG536_0G01550 [Torulaspora globosa]
MNGTRIAVKDLLVTRRTPGVVKSGPRPLQVPKSPLLTNFEKWSDKKRKLYFDSGDCMAANGLGSFHLNQNLFASLLASPMRCDRMSRLKLPREYLTQLKLKNLQPKLGKHSLQLGFGQADCKGGKSSYVVNSNELLKKNVKSASSWIPIPALMSNMRYFNVSDVLVDKENFASESVIELRRGLERELGKLPKNGRGATLEGWDIVVCLEPKANSPFEIVRRESLEVIMFNVKFLDSERWVREAIQSHRNHELGMVLKLPEDSELVKCIYRIWASFSLLR